MLRLLVVSALASAQVATAPAVLGIPNFSQVNERLYRGAQPAPNGYQGLANLGVRTVINLREEPAQIAAEERLVRAAGMRFVSIPMDDLGAPTDRQISDALALLNDDSAAPVFIHCRRGADRTGTVIACYRIAHDGWEKNRALDEAKSHGMSIFERGMRRYVLNFQPASGGVPHTPDSPAVP
jgi:uncharacterized protein (TIGR01244 family)